MDWALSVGIKNYPDPAFGDLSGPELDASAFHKWVVSPAGGGITEPKRAKLILSSQYNPPFVSPEKAQPTTEHINEFFKSLRDVVRENARKGEPERVGKRLYLYFSGHGFMPAASKDAVGLLMANAEKDSLGHYVLATGWADVFYQSGYFQEVLLFMDCCRNTLSNAPLNVPFLTPPNDPMAKKNGRRFYAFATKWDRTARERLLPNGDSRGVFTATLLAALEGGASDPATAQIQASDLRSFLYQNMKQFLAEEDRKNDDIPKEPDVYPSGSDEENFLISKTPNVPYPVRVHVSGAAAGREVKIYRGRKLAESTSAATQPYWDLALPRGAYYVEVAGRLEEEITLEVKHPGFDLANGVNHVSI